MLYFFYIFICKIILEVIDNLTVYINDYVWAPTYHNRFNSLCKFCYCFHYTPIGSRHFRIGLVVITEGLYTIGYMFEFPFNLKFVICNL